VAELRRDFVHLPLHGKANLIHGSQRVVPIIMAHGAILIDRRHIGGHAVVGIWAIVSVQVFVVITHRSIPAIIVVLAATTVTELVFHPHIAFIARCKAAIRVTAIPTIFHIIVSAASGHQHHPCRLQTFCYLLTP
jgi:hypothetical protein